RLRNIVERQVLGRTRPRLLVITYRYTDPPLGGAEVHLLELLRQLDRRGSFTIDVATLDIVAIHNRFHFSCRYTRDANAFLPSGEAWVFVGSAERIVVRGISFRRRHLRIRGANAALMDAVVDGQFELEVATTDHDAIAFEMETIDVPDDPRPLGFRLRSIDLHF